jgi:hypothetical protein
MLQLPPFSVRTLFRCFAYSTLPFALVIHLFKNRVAFAYTCRHNDSRDPIQTLDFHDMAGFHVG